MNAVSRTRLGGRSTQPGGSSLEKDAGVINIIDIYYSISNDDARHWCAPDGNDVVAVDIPFAWPKYFREFVSKWIPFDHSNRAVSQPPDSTTFRYRTTDRFVHDRTNKWPLSVSSQLFALGAREWAEVVHSGSLDSQIVVTKRSLPHKRKPYIVEVYPGATLKAFENYKPLSISGQSTRIVEMGGKAKEKEYSYKSDEITRRTLVEKLLSAFQIQSDQAKQDRLVDEGEKDHATDALLAALTGLIFIDAIDMWTVIEPRDDQIEDARAEGWIFFPEKSQETGVS